MTPYNITKPIEIPNWYLISSIFFFLYRSHSVSSILKQPVRVGRNQFMIPLLKPHKAPSCGPVPLLSSHPKGRDYWHLCFVIVEDIRSGRCFHSQATGSAVLSNAQTQINQVSNTVVGTKIKVKTPNWLRVVRRADWNDFAGVGVLCRKHVQLCDELNNKNDTAT